ncbi:hypothetical protein RIF25_04655 [Thermosynechococcaceae cyanobacterium BACA0444]|uniref:Uncharacterized protein n=1 Tax=Pseudocalidococcus azoricus BACA0444 TaxID=2918990 RepID=A0AAE4FR20_9CYAN|nr:hypothetical protein [Pseudocalidococcus azoricus]MDS3860094.1 hypothetical protein [Pseudocalidococcus azoricus BACA0444]
MKGNPNPVQTPEFKAKQFKAFGEVSQPLSSRVLGVKLPIDIDKAVFNLPPKERVPWVRRVIAEAAQRELMGNAPQATSVVSPTPGLDTTNGSGDDVLNLGATSGPGDVETKPKRGRKPKGEG